MFEGLSYITMYWLSGFAENNYEIWDSKKASIKATPDSLSFTAYLAWPQEAADDCQVTIRQTDTGLVFSPDWFPDEEFEVQVFDSRRDGSVLLMSKFQRETFFIHLRQQYD
jgi:hypothetical protein